MMRRLFLFSALLMVLLLLAACGSKESTGPAPATSVPASAQDTSQDTVAAKAPAGDGSTRLFVIDPAASEVRYEVDEEFFGNAVTRLGKKLGFFHAVGRTSAIQGQLEVAPGPPPQVVAGQFTVDISTLQSDDDRRDKKIREEFLESARFPLATFTVTQVEGLPAEYQEGETVSFQMTGDLTIREVTKPVTWEVQATLQDGVLSGEAQTLIFMKDFGFAPPDIAGWMKVTDGVTLVVDFTAREP